MTDRNDSTGHLPPFIGNGWTASVIAAAVGFGLIVFGTFVLESYGWTVFVGVPVVVGFLAVVFRGTNRPLSVGQCMVTSICAIAVMGAFLLGFAIEGAICIIMAAPLAVPLALLGGAIGYAFHRAFACARNAGWCAMLACLLLPALIGAESAANVQPRIASVSTAIEIDAPPEVVWRHVLAFDELPESRHWIFHTGIAYPIRAEIRGSGVGAVRHCIFSTGAFVEPITVWDEPRLLRFDVTQNPQPMKEWSLYSQIHPPHLDGFMLSERGQFELIPLPGGGTRLVGTTWYQHGLAPDIYWRRISDFIIHRIHLRVLGHIRTLAEHEQTTLP